MGRAGRAFALIIGQAPSVAEFFVVMFGVEDAVFILVAFFTAYKVGSGTADD